MLSSIQDILLFTMLVVAWAGVLVGLLSYKFDYQELVPYPALVTGMSTLYLLIFLIGTYSVRFALIQEEVVSASLLLVGVTLAVSFWLSQRAVLTRELNYVSSVIWSDMEAKSIDRNLENSMLDTIDKFAWAVRLYNSNSKCLFHSKECIDHVKHLLYDGRHKEALDKMSEHIEVFLLDKLTDEHRDALVVMNSFGSVTDNSAMLKTRVADSDLIENLLTEKRTAMSIICFKGSIYHQDDVNGIIEKDSSSSNIKRIASNLTDLYLYKEAQGFEPSYKSASL
ncbi:hypothetical protein [Vibrio mediterranei]|uniref:hypothetical protein n=1 Tax=Vibrio mediterranei TaxID=689 RepID=UPI004068DC0F